METIDLLTWISEAWAGFLRLEPVEQLAVGLTAERDAALRSNPDHWLDKADRAQSPELAAAGLRMGFSNIRESLAQITSRLAEHFAASSTETQTGIGDAKRFARLTQLLTPGDPASLALLDDLNLIEGSEISLDESEILLALPSNQQDAAALISAILKRNQEFLSQGAYRVCALLCRRAVLAAQQGGLFNSISGLFARFCEAYALMLCGQAREALEKVDALLPIEERVQGAEHANVLAVRHLQAKLLSAVGREREALEKVDALLPIRERVIGAEHPEVLNTRYLQAELLSDVGRANDALEKVNALLPIKERVMSAEHPDALATRYLQVSLLNGAGRASEALEKVDRLLPIEERVRGAEHPEVLATRYLQARLLHDVGRASEALEKVDALLQIRERVLGAEHPDVLRTLWLKAKILGTLERRVDACALLAQILPKQVAAQSEEHQYVRESQTLMDELGCDGAT